MPGTWIVTADRTSARVLEREQDELVVVRTLAHDEGRLHDTELGTDRPGRSFDRFGAGRHAMGSATGPHEQSAKAFASEIAKLLHSSRMEGRYSRLVLVAEPHFLGLLRAALEPTTARLVVQTVAKDLEHVPVFEVKELLADL